MDQCRLSLSRLDIAGGTYGASRLVQYLFPDTLCFASAIVECDAVRKALKEIENIHNWLAQVTPQFEKMFAPRPVRD